MSLSTFSSRLSLSRREASAAICPATVTLYGCFIFQRCLIMESGNAPYPTRMPASAAHFEKVRRTTRLSYSWTQSIRLSEENSKYASSRTTSVGSLSSRFSTSSLMREPSGLLGEVMNTILGGRPALARKSSSTSSTGMVKSASRLMLITSAPFTSASNLYMPNVGGKFTTASPVPGIITSRKRRSISSSAPAPTMMCSFGTPVYSSRASRSEVDSGSG
mmetsp:Transcript_3388/g.10300  ORF Transcript_3388/g.10300 Transcript_3388/m.10300 type:complete len:219 (-) Transcript_3388:276-932(-)